MASGGCVLRQVLAVLLWGAVSVLAGPVTTPVAREQTTPSQVCKLLASDSNKDFERYSLRGTASCTCVSDAIGQCGPMKLYPGVKPGSPDDLLDQLHRPQGPPQQQVALLQYQIQWQCYISSQQGKRCKVTWPEDGSWEPVCDCALADGSISIRRNYYITSTEGRQLQ